MLFFVAFFSGGWWQVLTPLLPGRGMEQREETSERYDDLVPVVDRNLQPML